MIWEDVWLVAKYQTNLEIAGSPRKVYRDRVPQYYVGVELLNGLESASNSAQPNSEYNIIKEQTVISG